MVISPLVLKRHRCGAETLFVYLYDGMTSLLHPTAQYSCLSLLADIKKMNATRAFAYRTDTPFYHTDAHSVLSQVSDTTLAVAVPIVAYWSLALFFHALDNSNWKWLDKYRLHDSAETKSKNLATPSQVFWAVLLQQAIQTGLGLLWVDDHEPLTAEMRTEAMHRVGVVVMDVAWAVLGKRIGTKFLTARGADTVYFVYWWAIPTIQFFFAMYVTRAIICIDLLTRPSRFCIDTWQYFLHRLMHVNKWLYKQFHSTHHRLYVPYAYGALYNHPVEGLLLDIIGAILAERLSSMTIRQAMCLFAFSTLKTVDDHCGYQFPYNPLQVFSGNTADYHDIHHQVRTLNLGALPTPLNYITIAGYRNQVQLLTALFRPLGRFIGHAYDKSRHRIAEIKSAEDIVDARASGPSTLIYYDTASLAHDRLAYGTFIHFSLVFHHPI